MRPSTISICCAPWTPLVTDQAEVDAVSAGLLRPPVDQTLSVVFHDMTTIRAEGLLQQPDDVRQYGMAKEGVIVRQFMLDVVQTAEGLPLYHEVFDGNTAEVTPLKPTIEKVLSRLPVRRVIVVIDRGLLSIANLAEGGSSAKGSPSTSSGMTTFPTFAPGSGMR